MDGCINILHKPSQAVFQAQIPKVRLDTAQTDVICVCHQHGGERSHETRRSIDEDLNNDSIDVVEPLAWNNVVTFAQMRGTKTNQSVLEL